MTELDYILDVRRREDERVEYDPGYAGGGYSHSECDHCGGTLP